MSTEQTLSESLEPVAVDASSRLIVDLARRVAGTDCTVLIVGESGTGKEVLARLIHRASPRAKQAVHRGQLRRHPREHARSHAVRLRDAARSPARTNAHAGKFEQAQGGTLLLDEITEMPLALQAKLLRVLQEREVERIGGTRAQGARRARHRHHQPHAARRSGRRPLPRRSLLPSQRIPPGAQPAARAPRRRPAAGHASAADARASRASAFRRCRPMRRTCCSPIPGPATCASSTTCCSARWCWSKAR